MLLICCVKGLVLLSCGMEEVVVCVNVCVVGDCGKRYVSVSCVY